jgi:hypothetical protein
VAPDLWFGAFLFNSRLLLSGFLNLVACRCVSARRGIGIFKRCLRLFLLVTAWLSAETLSPLAQNADTPPAEHESTKEAQAAERLAEPSVYSNGRLVIQNAFG